MKTDALDRTLHEMAGGGAAELVLIPGSARAHNGGSNLGLSDLPSLSRRSLEAKLMTMAGTESWAGFMASPGDGLQFRFQEVFDVSVRYESGGPVAVIKVEGAVGKAAA